MTETKKLMCVLKDLGESSSLHGIPKIISSRKMAVKVLWCILLIGAVALTSYQIVLLIQEFNSYPVKTTVTLNYDKLYFPTITICNSNPIKLSKLSQNEQMYDILLSKLDSKSDNVDPWAGIETLETASLYDNIAEPLIQDSFDAWRKRVLSLYRGLPYEEREEIGHSLTDMLHKLSFRGYQYLQTVEDSTYHQSPAYGNCYAINLNASQETSGPAKGIQLVLNIEKDEYIEHFVSGYGMRLSIHQPGTFALPDQDSFVLNPGYETHIGLKLVRVSRLGGNYGTCIDADEMYSVPTCFAVCTKRHIEDACGCTPYDSPYNGTDDNICNMDQTDVDHCVTNVKADIYDEIRACICPPRCNEDLYSTTINGRKWPNINYLEHVLMRQACKRNVSSLNASCERLKFEGSITRDSYEEYASNFVSVNIYFEDLNFEMITEEPLYNTVRFLSDLGGAMGFYMGASLLTYVELLELIVEVCLYFKSICGSKNKPSLSGNLPKKTTRVEPIS